MRRFIVTRQYVKFKGKMYQKGELLPPEFTERDRCRNIYPSRIGTIDVPDSMEDKEEVSNPIVPPVTTPVSGTVKGTATAAKPLSSSVKPTGTLKAKTASVSRVISSK